MPLEPTHVVLTREDDALAALLARRGYAVLTLPCVHVQPADAAALRRAVRALGADDRLVVTSPHGADAVLAAVPAREIRSPVTAVGAATAARLRDGGVAADVSPEPRGASLARALELPRGTVLLARSDRALPDLPAILRERGARVAEVAAYRTVAEARGDLAAARAVAPRAVVVFASPSAVEAFSAAVPARPLAAVAIGATTAARAREVSDVVVTAARPDGAAVAEAIARAEEVTRGVRA